MSWVSVTVLRLHCLCIRWRFKQSSFPAIAIHDSHGHAWRRLSVYLVSRSWMPAAFIEHLSSEENAHEKARLDVPSAFDAWMLIVVHSRYLFLQQSTSFP